MKERYLANIRLLAECYHAFQQMSAIQVRSFGLTPSQFDIIATLGNTPGMTLGELGHKTLPRWGGNWQNSRPIGNRASRS